MKTTITIALFFMAVVGLSELNAGTFVEEKGTFQVGAKPESVKTPEIYHLKKAIINYILKPKHQLPVSNVDVFILTFPSLITTPFPENNMVYAEYYVPRNLKTFPATVVLDITGGDQSLSRTISSYLASRGIGCLFVQMAYYGPRRPPDSKVRLLSPDIKHTLKAIQQTVLDIRTAVAWTTQRCRQNQNWYYGNQFGKHDRCP